MSGEALAGALEHAAAGYAVAPVSLRLADGTKHADFHTKWRQPDGISDDPEQIKAWAREFPGCGWHLPCGPNGVVVVDQDVKRGPDGELLTDGRRSWRIARGPSSPMVIATQSGGAQLYFRAPAVPIRNSAKAIKGVPEVDVRGDGGTVFLSGTSVRGGGQYVANRVLPAAELPELPAAWADRLRSAGPTGKRADRTSSGTRSGPRRVKVASGFHERAWVEAKVEDELREIGRGGRRDFRARLAGAAGVAFRGVALGLISEAEVLERLHDAVRRVWDAEPDARDHQWIEEDGRRMASESPWHLTREDPPARLDGLQEPAADESPEDVERRGLEREVERELRTLRARQEAQRRLRAEGRIVERPTPVVLRDFLAVDDEPAQYRIEGLLPVGARAMLAAQAKAGKSTLRDNLTRALVDGLPFLGEHAIEPFAGRVVLIDAELDERMLRRWLREQRIGATDRVAVVSLRGRVSSFDITDQAVRAEWAAVLRELEPAVVVLDCLRPVLDAIGLDEDKDAGRFLVAFDELLELAGAGEAVVVHHMGHNGERARGSTRLRDWPDVEWRLTRKDPEDPASPRYFAAYGRDVDLPERELGYDAASRRLTTVGGSRRDADATAAGEALLKLLGEEEGLSGRAIEEALLPSHAKRAIRNGIKTEVTAGRVVVRSGPRGAVLHYLSDAFRSSSAPVRRSAPPVRREGEIECASAPIGGALIRTGAVESSAPHEDVA